MLSPLHTAVIRGNFAACKALLFHGSLPDLIGRSSNGDVNGRPIEFAIKIKATMDREVDERIVALLRDWGKSHQTTGGTKAKTCILS